MPDDPVLAARRLAEAVLLPDAAAVDAAERIPEAHLAALDGSGLTGLAAGRPTLEQRVDATAALAGGCLATAFVWLQHQGALGAVAGAGGPVASSLPELAAGRLRAGVVVTAVRGPDPLRLRDGRISGRASWVTGWGIAQVLLVAAVDDGGGITTALLDVGPGMRAEPAALTAANASATVTLRFDAVPVPVDRVVDRVPQPVWDERDAAGLAANGGLALGVAHRAASLAGSSALLAGIESARAALLAADVPALPAARAACSALAVRAAAVLAVQDGGRSAIRGSRADRLQREAQFLLGFGTRPAIRAELLRTLGG